jgi:hypothetical protein
VWRRRRRAARAPRVPHPAAARPCSSPPTGPALAPRRAHAPRPRRAAPPRARSGRKNASLLYCLTYGASCVTKHWNSYRVLMLGRVLGGIATSLLFTAFESWLVSEHFKARRAPAAARRQRPAQAPRSGPRFCAHQRSEG